MTVNQIKSDNEFLCGIELPEHEFNLYLIYQGTEKLKYFAFYEGKILFYGVDFKPSPMHCIDSLESIISCLGFLTTQRGDTDKEFFKNYNERQLRWTETIGCEWLKCLVNDFDDQESEHHYGAKKYFEMHFIK